MCAIPQRGMVRLPPACRASAPRVPAPRLRRPPPRPPPPEASAAGRAAHEDAGNRHATSADRHVPVDDELPRLSGREREALEERHRLQPPGEDGLDVEREDVVEARALERQQPEPAEPPEELLPFLLRLLVLLPDARLQFPRPLAEPPQDVLRSPEFLLVLQPVLLQELVLRLDALRLPRMGGPLELRSRELRVAQRLTPWPVPSSLPSFLPSSLPFCGLLRLGGLEGGLLRDADRQARPPVRAGALPADLLARLMPDALVRSDHLHAVDVVPPVDLDVGAERVQIETGLPVFRPVHHPVRERLAEVPEGRLDLVRLLLGEVPEPIALRDRREVGDRLRDPDPDARDRRERVRDPPRPVQIRVRHAHDVPEVLLHALELLRRLRGLRFLLLLVLLLRRPLPSFRLRRGGRGLGLGRGLLLGHSTIPGWDTRPNFTSYIRVKESGFCPTSGDERPSGIDEGSVTFRVIGSGGYI